MDYQIGKWNRLIFDNFFFRSFVGEGVSLYCPLSSVLRVPKMKIIRREARRKKTKCTPRRYRDLYFCISASYIAYCVGIGVFSDPIRFDPIRSDPIRQTSACISDIVFRPASDWNWFLLWYATLARRFGSFLFGMIPHRPKWYPILTLIVWSIQQKLKKKKLAQNLRVNRRPDRAWVTVSATRADVSQEETSKQHKGLCESARTILIAVRSEWLLVESPYRLPRDALE